MPASHPAWPDGHDRRGPGGHGSRLRDRIEAEESEAQLVAAGAHFARLLATQRHDRAKLRRRSFDTHREQAFLDQPAVLGARRQLLADITALLPIDAVQ